MKARVLSVRPSAAHVWFSFVVLGDIPMAEIRRRLARYFNQRGSGRRIEIKPGELTPGIHPILRPAI